MAGEPRTREEYGHTHEGAGRNLPDRQLKIRRNPQPDATVEIGHGYGSLTTLKPGDNMSPLATPNGVVPVERLFF